MNEHTKNADSTAKPPKCPTCGSADVVKNGIKYRKKGPTQRWLCKSCGHIFVDDVSLFSRFSVHVSGRALDLLALGLSPAQVARLMSSEGTSITAQSVVGIALRFQPLLSAFEHEKLKETFSKGTWPSRSGVWYLDDMYIKLSRVDWGKSMRYVWLTNAFEEESKYWLAAHVSEPRVRLSKESVDKPRGIEATQDVLIKALSCGFPRPVELRCDGHREHIDGAYKTFPDTPIISRTKDEEYWFINPIERLQHSIRKFLNRIGRMHTVETLRCLIELYRLYYNFIRPHKSKSLGGETPARASGVSYPRFERFEDFIKYAYSFLAERGKSPRRPK